MLVTDESGKIQKTCKIFCMAFMKSYRKKTWFNIPQRWVLILIMQVKS